MTSDATDPVLAKLRNIMRVDDAERVWQDGLRSLGVSNLSTPDDRVRFGRYLITRGGLLAVIGRSIVTQAVLHGASELAKEIVARSASRS